MGLLSLFSGGSAGTNETSKSSTFLSGNDSKIELQMKNWTQSIRKEIRECNKQIREIERQEFKVKQDIKKSAKADRISVVKILAKELVQSKKAKERIYTCIAEMNSINREIQHQISMLKMTHCIKSSGNVMRSMNRILNVPNVRMQMESLSKEMMKAGLIEETLAESLEGTLDANGEIEEEAELEVNKAIDEVLAEMHMKIDPTGIHILPKSGNVEESENKESEELRSRLKNL